MPRPERSGAPPPLGVGDGLTRTDGSTARLVGRVPRPDTLLDLRLFNVRQQDPIANNVHLPTRYGPFQGVRFGLGDQQRGVEHADPQPLPGRQAVALQPIQPAPQTTRSRPVVQPLAAVQIAQIQHPSRGGHLQRIRSHAGRKGHHGVERDRPAQAAHHIPHRRFRVKCLGDRATTGQAYQSPPCRRPPIKPNRHDFLTVLCQRFESFLVRRRVQEASAPDAVPFGQMLDLPESPQLVAFVRRKRNPMGQVQDIHGFTRECVWTAAPRPYALPSGASGPIPAAPSETAGWSARDPGARAPAR